MPIEDPSVGVGLQILARVINDGTTESRLAVRRLFERAVRERRPVIVVYTGHRRLVHPHRIWQRDVPGQLYLFECWQEEGQSDWGEPEPPSRHVQMWFTFMLERTESAELTDGRFEVHEGFAESPARSLGRVASQVARGVIRRGRAVLGVAAGFFGG